MATIYRRALNRTIRKTFSLWQALGFHITPNHFYQPIPDTRTLGNELWDKPSSLPGIDLPNKEQQADTLKSLSAFRSEYEAFPVSQNGEQFYLDNGQFGSVDAEIYYSMIRSKVPKTIIEIGAGFSTHVATKAVTKNGRGKLIAIDPCPRTELKQLPITWIEKRLQDVPLETFDCLEAGDILFIDSSHVVTVGSDVNYEILELLPALKPGVTIHIHDIFWPSANYPKYRVIDQKEFWTEQYLVQAFLAFNSAFKVRLCASYLHRTAPEVLEQNFRSYKRQSNWPGSLWIERVS